MNCSDKILQIDITELALKGFFLTLRYSERYYPLSAIVVVVVDRRLLQSHRSASNLLSD